MGHPILFYLRHFLSLFALNLLKDILQIYHWVWGDIKAPNMGEWRIYEDEFFSIVCYLCTVRLDASLSF